MTAQTLISVDKAASDLPSCDLSSRSYSEAAAHASLCTGRDHDEPSVLPMRSAISFRNFAPSLCLTLEKSVPCPLQPEIAYWGEIQQVKVQLL